MKKGTKRTKKFCDCRPSSSGNPLLTKKAWYEFFQKFAEDMKI